MSGHSKWSSIKHKKGAADAQRGKIFTKHGHLIALAAQSGGDPESNATLRMAIDNAKRENVPNANIEKAIKRGTGELKDGKEISEVTYEGYGPGGVAVIVECLTDNKNRSVTNVRTIFGKKGGNFGNVGSVSWMFDRKGVMSVKKEGLDFDEAELSAIDAGAEDVERHANSLTVYTSPTDLNEVKNKMKAMGFEIEKSDLTLIPNQTVKIEDEVVAKKILEFMEALDEDEDVSDVFSNFEMESTLMEKLSA